MAKLTIESQGKEVEFVTVDKGECAVHIAFTDQTMIALHDVKVNVVQSTED